MEQLTPDEAVAMALQHHRAGRLEQAETIYRQVLATVPDHILAMRMLGVIASQCGKHDDALTLLKHASQGGDIDTILDLAVASRAAGRADEAEAAYRHALVLSGELPRVMTAYGQFLKLAGRHEESLAMLQQAADKQPDSAAAQNILGIALAELQRFGEASKCFRRAIEIDPKFAQAYNNLGTEQLHQKQPRLAEEEFRKAIEVDPGYALAYDNLGSALIRQGRQADAVSVLEKALELRPEFVKAHESLSWALIALGEWERGFAEYEWRLKMPGRSMLRTDIKQPRWAGEELSGKSILLYAEPPMSDAIQFARYVSLVARRGGRVTLVSPPALMKLLASLPGVERVISPTEVMPPFDVHCSLSSLPFIFKTSPETVPSGKAAYLTPPPEIVQKWKAELANEPRKKVGIAWPSDLTDLQSLADVAGVKFYNLVKSSNASVIGAEDCSSDVDDFADLAGLLKNMDLVIAADTMAAHVAGAMGRPTVLLLEFTSDCRWMKDSATTPWYGSVKLFRQKVMGEWPEVVARVKRSFEGWAKK